MWPRVTWKTATSLDGRIALANGKSQWITGPAARLKVQALRARHDCVLTGSGTVIADDPMMSVRVPGLLEGREPPVRVVLDTWGNVPAGAQVLTSPKQGRVIVYTAVRRPLAMANVETAIMPLGEDNRRLDLSAVLRDLHDRGLKRVMLESGGRLAASFVRLGRVDEIVWFRAPVLLGGDGMAVVDALGYETLEQAMRFELVSSERLGNDACDTYMRAQQG